MTLDICRFCPSNESCCVSIRLRYVKSTRRVYKNTSRLQKYPFLHRDGNVFQCDRYDPNRENGHCADYVNRPYFCRDFICKEAVEIVELVQEPWMREHGY